MSVKNFNRNPLTITWRITEENITTWQVNSLTETYTRYYGDATPTPSPSCPWGGSWTSISVDPYPIPDYVTESAAYAMYCQYAVPTYMITWEVIEKNLGTWETRVSDEYFTCSEWDATPVPNTPSVNPWDWNPWTSSSIDPTPPSVTGPATYYAVFNYDPVVIPTGFYGSYNVRDPQWAFGSDYSLISNYQSYLNSLWQTQMYYVYNKESSSVWTIIQAMYLSGDIFLYHFKYDITSWLLINNIGYWKLVGVSSGSEYNFRYNGDTNYINQTWSWRLDNYISYLFNTGVIPLS